MAYYFISSENSHSVYQYFVILDSTFTIKSGRFSKLISRDDTLRTFNFFLKNIISFTFEKPSLYFYPKTALEGKVSPEWRNAFNSFKKVEFVDNTKEFEVVRSQLNEAFFITLKNAIEMEGNTLAQKQINIKLEEFFLKSYETIRLNSLHNEKNASVERSELLLDNKSNLIEEYQKNNIKEKDRNIEEEDIRIEIIKKLDELNKKIDSLNQNFSKNNSSIEKNKSILTKNSPFLKNYYSGLFDNSLRTEIQSYATFTIVGSYFKFMVKMFGYRLLKEEFNDLLIHYGEKIVPGSFEVYTSFMNKSYDVQAEIIREAMLKNSKEENEKSN